MIFVEMPWFTQRRKKRMSDEVFRALQNGLLTHPQSGDVMPGCGGLRKVRYADPSRGKGKRGGVRIVYLYIPEAFRIDLIDIYGKDEKADLTPQEKRVLSELAGKVRTSAIAAYKRSGGA
jgi:hypothetical protein